ncbi:MAG: ester cyclase [Candidatus Dormibacteraeota bacterium]|nr:ester cyclase [Candidatus Dormibacteraeota bacterium]
MNAGVVRAKLKLDGIDKVVAIYREQVLPGYGRLPGARGGQMWVNRQTGDMLTIGIYDDEQSVKDFQPVADQAQASIAPFREGDKAERETYELAASTQLETRALVEKAVRDFNAQDSEAAARSAAPDFEGTSSGGVPTRGAQGQKEFNQRWFKAFPDGQVTINQLTILGTRAVLEGTFTGTHTGPLETDMGEVPATGKKVSEPFVQITEVDRGLFKSARLIYDRMSLAVQLGIMPAGVSQQR